MFVQLAFSVSCIERQFAPFDIGKHARYFVDTGIGLDRFGNKRLWWEDDNESHQLGARTVQLVFGDGFSRLENVIDHQIRGRSIVVVEINE